MGQRDQKNNTDSKFKLKLQTIFLGLFVGGALILTFNNCGPMSQIQFVELSEKTNSEITNELTKIHHVSIGNDFCEQSKNYECILKIFSSTNNSLIPESAQQCMSTLSGHKICPNIKVFNYDSSTAKQNCRDNCNEDFDYIEYDCHLRLSVNPDGKFPLIERKPGLKEAIDLLFDACVAIQEGAPQ